MSLDSRPTRVAIRWLLYHQAFLPRRIRWRILGYLLGAQSFFAGARIVLHTSHLRPGRSGISFGQSAQVGDEVLVDVTGHIDIGERVTISERASIYTHDHVTADAGSHWRDQGIEVSDLRIDDEAWIGAGAVILPSVNRIGRGAVVGAGAVVVRDVEALQIVVGNPARVVSKRGSKYSANG